MSDAVECKAKVSLQRIEFGHIGFVSSLFNDSDVVKNDLSMHGWVSQYSLEKNYDKLFSAADHDRFIILNDISAQPLGLISARSHAYCPGSYAISIAVSSSARQKGCGSTATGQLLSFLFLNRRAERVSAGVREYNLGGLRWAEACGFQLEGRERHACFFNGRYFDILNYSILADEFLNSRFWKFIMKNQIDLTSNLSKSFNVSGTRVYFNSELFSFTTGSPMATTTTGPPRIDARILRSIFLNISNACNLSCEYCFAGQGNYGRKNQLMSAAVAKNIVSDLSCYDRIGIITFFGGEPLLNYDILRLLVESLFEKTTRFALITNGSVLDDKMLSLLEQYKFSITVSFDGPKQIHDAQRGLFERTANNIAKLMGASNIRLKLACQLTERHFKAGYDRKTFQCYFDDHFPKIPVIFSEVAAINLPNDYNYYCVNANREDQIDQTFRALAGDSEAVPSKSVTSILAKLLFKSGSDYFCEKCDANDTLSFDVDGSTSPCHVFFGRKIEDGTEANPFLLTKTLVEPCAECWARKLCKICPGDSTAQLPVSVSTCSHAIGIERVITRLLELKLTRPDKYPEFLSNFRHLFNEMHLV